jgi:serine/threonine-protein kinase
MICPSCLRTYDADATFCPADGARLAAPTARDGVVVDGRYVLRGLIGEGGTAHVYLAEDTQAGTGVAVKVLKREHTASRVVRERFLCEVEVAAAIGHPNVVRILDAGELPDRAPFMVLELLSGETVAARLGREGALAVDVAFGLAKAIASALSAAHAAGIVHRDIKPDNVFLPRGGGLKVVDFGMAKLREGMVTAAGLALGTVPYMAPEQALADPIDGRTDVYGLGVTLFRMVTGRLPFSTDNDARLVAQHLYVAPARPSAVRPGIDPRAEEIILACLRKWPINRYVSMDALIEDLERVLGERPGPIEPPPLLREPDSYEPVNPMSRSVAKLLRGLV